MYSILHDFHSIREIKKSLSNLVRDCIYTIDVLIIIQYWNATLVFQYRVQDQFVRDRLKNKRSRLTYP